MFTNLLKNIKFHIFVVVFCFVFIFTNEYIKNNLGKSYIEFLSQYYLKFNLKHHNQFYSSVICRGTNHTNRICHFKNLCYHPNTQLYLFLHSEKSIKSGLPKDRFSPTLIDFSSVLDHNTQYFNFFEIPDTSLDKFNVSYDSGNFLMFKRFNPENLMHVFHDDLLPVFSTLLEIHSIEVIKNGAIKLIFADNRPPGPYKDLYENFLSNKPFYVNSLFNDSLHCFENTHVGLNKYSVWYQYGFKEPQGPLDRQLQEISPIIYSFRDYFIERFSISSRNEECALLLTRKQNRKILNELEVVHAITDVSGLKTIALSLEEYSVFQIISHVLSCQMIVGMHGSILILALFLKPYSVLFEMFPFGISPNISTPFRTLASIPGLKLIYQEWQNKIKVNSFPHPEYPPHLGGINHLSNEEQNQIKNSTVSPFLCCDNPIWLYRVYQDTIIDLDSVKHALTESQKKRLKIMSVKEDKNNFYPSEVQNMSCHIDSHLLTVKWQAPWNIAFMNNTHLEYEIWIQDTDSDDIRAFITKKLIFKFKINLITKLFYIWIRCYSSGYIGPFNSIPLICNK